MKSGSIVCDGEPNKIINKDIIKKVTGFTITDDEVGYITLHIHSSLDVENESLIQEALSELIRQKTVIVIAHRMRTIRNADKIVLLDNGKIEAIGTDKELLEKSITYRKMINDSKMN